MDEKFLRIDADGDGSFGGAIHLNPENVQLRLRSLMQVSERAQAHRQKLLLVSAQRKVTPQRVSYATHCEQFNSKRHRSWGQKRLGNSCKSNYQGGAGVKGRHSTGSRTGLDHMRLTQPGHTLPPGLAASSRRPGTFSAPARRTDHRTRTRCCEHCPAAEMPRRRGLEALLWLVGSD